MTQTETGPNGITITTLDGFGRVIRVKRKDGSGIAQSYQDTVYAPCACSPLGKIQQASMPYAPFATEYWTTYTYDGLGRAVSVQQPDGASTTTDSYLGNQTTITDPAGKWKTSTTDVLGNLLTVVEPDPCVTANTLTTSYTYDWMNHISGVTMTRPNMTYASGGSCSESGTPVTQTRTFVYSDAGLLTSATNPENGTVTYTYNSTNTLNVKTDAKGQTTNYSYNSLIPSQVLMVQHFPVPGTEDLCQRVTYTYGTVANLSYNRLATAVYGSGGACASYGGITVPSFTETYSYNAPGGVTNKTVTSSALGSALPASVTYTYDSYGRSTSVRYPFYSASSPTTFTTAYDNMGRPNSLIDSTSATWVQNVGYDYTGRLLGIQFLNTTKTLSYNTTGQLAGLNWSTTGATGMTGGVQYSFSATQNNGQITQATDTLSGETTVYQYDSLKRLASAASTPTSGSTPPAWTELFGYL